MVHIYSIFHSTVLTLHKCNITGSKPAHISSYIHKLLPSCARLAYEEYNGLINGKLLSLHSHTGEHLELEQVSSVCVRACVCTCMRMRVPEDYVVQGSGW